LDIDEYMALNVDRSASVATGDVIMQPAAQTFDSMNRKGQNSLLVTWLNFQLDKSLNSSRALSAVVMSGHRPALRHGPGSKRKSDCYGIPKEYGFQGKVVLLCDRGLGFSVHEGYQIPSVDAPLDRWVRAAYSSSLTLRTWHPRRGGSRSPCEFQFK
jgi:hypothetical protein